MKAFLFSILLFMIYPGKRQVLIFYSEKGVAQKDKQLAELKKEADCLKERDMTIETYATNTASSDVKQWRINAAQPFTVLLVGKDGGEKLRSDTVVPTSKFFNTIDAMPMRKNEMKDK